MTWSDNAEDRVSHYATQLKFPLGRKRRINPIGHFLILVTPNVFNILYQNCSFHKFPLKVLAFRLLIKKEVYAGEA